MMSILRLLLTVCLLLAATGVPAQTLQNVPALTQRVTDLAGILDPSVQSALEQKLRSLEQQTGSQLAVLIVRSTQPEAIEQYSIRVVDAWKLGRDKIDDGVLLLVASDDRKVRIEVGYGLEGALPDARAHQIIERIIKPHFASGDFGGGLSAAADAIAAAIRGESLPLPRKEATTASGVENLLPIILIIAFVIGIPFKRALGLLPGALATGGIAGLVAWLLLGALGVAALAAIVTFLLSLITGTGPGRWSNGGGFGGGLGGGGFGGRGGGGFGGGFGGGGGGFGGGGASGGW
ncbi:MAG: TPM domain-containing protein [Halioglobus sp.]